MAREIDWKNSGPPDSVERARFYAINTSDPTERFYYLDPATGTVWCEDTYIIAPKVQWYSSIQTFPHGEVRNA